MNKALAIVVLTLVGITSFAARFGNNTISTIPAATVACSKDGKTIYVTTDSGEVIKSDDGGSSFSKLSGFGTSTVGAIGAISVACSSDGDTVYICTGAAQIIKATDGGRNGLRSFGALKGTGTRYIADVAATTISCSGDGKIVFTTSKNGKLFVSTDGGDRFKAL
jgi:photosystem II stability/assembly factor-like uncharacterized protein